MRLASAYMTSMCVVPPQIPLDILALLDSIF
jgi:hypothetical protein